MTHSKTISEFPAANGLWPHGNPAPVRRHLLTALSSGILLGLIQFYRYTFSPAQVFLFGADSGCRFTPTCSQYALEAIREHGAMTGSMLAVKRICRCHPLGDCGHDPVPASKTNDRPHLP
jgi:putative membrane protein insertion efficiency factor